MSFAVFAPPPSPLGSGVPALTPHAVSVSLPKWQDNVDYEEGASRVTDAMKCGYPRFFIHPLIKKLSEVTIARFGNPDEESCILVPTWKVAQSCVEFLSSLEKPVACRVVVLPVSAPNAPSSDKAESSTTSSLTIYACVVQKDDFPYAKQFWQHTGDGISSRRAERALTILGEMDADVTDKDDSNAFSARVAPKSGRYGVKNGTNGRYNSAGPSNAAANSVIPNLPSSKSRYGNTRGLCSGRSPSAGRQGEDSDTSSLSNSVDSLVASPHASSSTSNGFSAPIEQEEDVLSRYVEERYGRNLDLSLAPLAKLARRRRIAGVLRESPGQAVPVEKIEKSTQEESDRGVEGLTEDDVWLYPCGMSAIWHAHQLVMAAKTREGGQIGKSVCFGFPYTDTLKILQKWGPGCHFLGHGLARDLPALRSLCESASTPIVALFCEFPSNPLLRSPPLIEIRKLADEFGFMVVVDETIAGFVNVEVLPQADIVVSSLTKVFSGDCNVMGGSLVVNPKSKHYAALKASQEAEYEDMYFDEDVMYMERNSRDFQDRVAQMNYNTETVCDLLRSRRANGPIPEGMSPAPVSTRPSVIKEVYYPKYMTPENYEACLRPFNPSNPNSSGYGALFSVTFTSLVASRAFFDALQCYKGPSLGTNFTIASPYTILAHYGELPWAAEWGVDDGLVRISVGLEDAELLKDWITVAIAAAEKAVQTAN